MTAGCRTLVVASVTTVLALQAGLMANAQTPEAAKPATPGAATPPSAASKPAAAQPRRFASAEEAVRALVGAVRGGNTEALVGILGRDSRALVVSGDPVLDRRTRERFLAEYDAASTLVADGETTVLHIGRDDWPFPIPLVKDGDRWRFDARRGRDEILARRIGRNELYTIQTCLAYVDAQREYYATDRNGDGILEYAKRFASTPGSHDGLYWPTQPGERPSPLGELVVRARAEGYRRETAGHTPFHGYFYRILTAQGPSAPDGAYDYVVRGHMLAGFALVALPAQYGVSGVMTFIVNHDGVVYQKDLGPRTRELAMAMRAFDPDPTWRKAEIPELTATSPVSPSR
jgi:hypothetical protein